ncbi:ABC transporter permease [Sesbania bispinosa]|nr:ABC transporter permease [Sesbania bispinosa]
MHASFFNQICNKRDDLQRGQWSVAMAEKMALTTGWVAQAVLCAGLEWWLGDTVIERTRCCSEEGKACFFRSCSSSHAQQNRNRTVEACEGGTMVIALESLSVVAAT